MKLPKIFSVPIVLGHFDFGDKEYFIPKAGLPKYRGKKVLYLIGQRPIFENWSFGIREHCSSRQWLWNTEGRSRTKEDPTNSRNQRIHQLRLLGIMLTVSFKIYLVPEGICSPGNSESLCEWLKGPPGRRAPGDANREGVLPYHTRIKTAALGRATGLPACLRGCPTELEFSGNQVADYVCCKTWKLTRGLMSIL